MTSTFRTMTKQKPALTSLLLQKYKFNIFKVKQKKKCNKIQMQSCGIVGGIFHLCAPWFPSDRL